LSIAINDATHRQKKQVRTGNSQASLSPVNNWSRPSLNQLKKSATQLFPIHHNIHIMPPRVMHPRGEVTNHLAAGDGNTFAGGQGELLEPEPRNRS